MTCRRQIIGTSVRGMSVVAQCGARCQIVLALLREKVMVCWPGYITRLPSPVVSEKLSAGRVKEMAIDAPAARVTLQTDNGKEGSNKRMLVSA